MIPNLLDPPFPKHVNHIRILHSRKPVRDYDYGPLLRRPLEGCLDEFFGFGV